MYTLSGALLAVTRVVALLFPVAQPLPPSPATQPPLSLLLSDRMPLAPQSVSDARPSPEAYQISRDEVLYLTKHSTEGVLWAEVAALALPKLKPNLLRPPRRKRAVTIGIGFECSDGLVLATDTQYTRRGYRSHGPKLFPCEDANRNDIKILVAGAGTVSYMRRAIEMFRSELHALSSPTTEGIRVAAEKAITDFYKAHLYPNPKYDPDDAFELLFGVWTKSDGVALLSSNDTVVERANTDASGFATIGCGSDVAEYASGFVLNKPFSVEEAKYVSVVCVKAAKDNVEACGGNTEVRIMRPTSNGCLQEKVPGYEIERTETFALSLREALKLVTVTLDAGQDGEALPDGEVGSFTDAIREVLLDFRKERKEWRNKKSKFKKGA